MNKNLTAVPDVGTKLTMTSLLKNSFTLTQGVLILAMLVTVVGIFRTKDKKICLAFALESAVAAIATYFYSIYTNRIINKDQVSPSELTENRYLDWYITTPIMLFVLILVLGIDISKIAQLVTIVLVILLDFAMLHFGYLGETGTMKKPVACLWGFIPFFIMFALIYRTFLVPNQSNKKNFLFGAYVVVWALYGLVFLLDETNKNIATNLLDAVAKGGVGIGLYTHFLE
jgi:bacteriorhodopsin